MTRVLRNVQRAAPFAVTGLSSASNFLASLLAVLTGSTAQFGAFSFAMALVLLTVMLTRSAVVEPVLSSGRSSRALVPVAGAVGLVAGAISAVAGVVIGGGMGRSLVVIGVALPFLLMQDAGRAVLIHAGRAGRALQIEVVWLSIGAACVVATSMLAELSPLIVLACWSASGVAASLVLVANRRWLPAGTIPDVLQFVRERLLDVIATAVLLRGFAQVATVLSGVVLGLAAFGALRTSILLLTPLNPIIQTVRVLAVRSEGEVVHRTRHARRVYQGLVVSIAAWLGLMVVVRLSLPDTRLFRDVDLLVLVLVGCAWILQAVGTYLETTYRLADRYRELSRRYMVSSPLAFTAVVSLAALGLRAAAAGILLAATIRCVVLGRRRYSGVPATEVPLPARDVRLGSLRVPPPRAARPPTAPTAPTAPFVAPTSAIAASTRPGRDALARNELILTIIVLASLRPFRTGAAGQAAVLAQYAATAFAVWDVATRPAALRRWASHVYIWVPLALAATSLLWSAAPRSTVGGLVDLIGVSAISVMVMARLPPIRRLVPVFRAVLIVGLVNLAVFLSGSGAGPRGTFVGLFEQKNGLGRAAFLVAICALVLAVLGQVRSRVLTGSLLVALTLAFFARSGTSTLLIVTVLLLAPLLFQRLREVEPYRFNAVVLYATAGALTAWAAVGSFNPSRLALQLLGRNLDQNTAEVRRSLWRLVIEDIQQRPWFGHGFSTFELGEIVVWTGTRQTTWSVKQAHNGFIDVTYQLGLLGVAVVVVLQVVLLVRVGRAARSDAGLRPWLVALVSYSMLIAAMNWTYSTLFGRLGIFWLLQSVLAVAVTDRLATGRDDAQPDGRVPLTSDERIDARVGMAEGSLAEVVDDAGS